MPSAGLPVLSVVTPCLNSERTLRQTMESVWGQRYPALQHVVVDGGSKDGTLEILRDYPDAEVTSEPDGGLGDALNKGLRRARGEMIGWLNADDVYEPGALHRVGEALRDSPDAHWVTSPCRIIDAGNEEIRHRVTRYKSALLRRYSYGTLLLNNYVSAPATFFAAATLAEVGFFDERYRFAMDYDLWLRIGRLGPPLVLYPKPLASFRMAPGTLSMSGFELQFQEHAAIARAHARGAERPIAVLNSLLSRSIVRIYRAMQRSSV